ncbi:pantothenate transporter liz1 [Penicillium taxi]|uniref:pantothenate transporter liz1 n=1 Tax=Penicillium taxi TaxID=168475 RepID=UPI002544E848|nr:pantothenate transporter liz1 [Penicillium taxi]KAJ5901479.1 pantothenate transporter liz1 [Penicillium taxi]
MVAITEASQAVMSKSDTSSSNDHESISKEVVSNVREASSENDEKQIRSRWRKIVGFVWDSVEGNAFVSGMQEDLQLYGNERNWLNTWFSLGIMVGSVPAQMSQVSFIRSSYLLPTCELIWSALVIGMGFAKNIKTMYVLRFFIGLFEACSFPGYIAMLGGWYGPKELTKRLAILLQIESIASMFSSYLQAGLYSSMDGHAGLAGWRWMFIFDAVITFYWRPEDVRYGIERIEKLGQKAQTKLTKSEIKRIFLGWELWSFVVPYTMVAACHSATSYFNLWLKAAGYSVVKVNVLPTGGSALDIVVTILWGMIADRYGKHYWLIISIQLLMMLSNILLSIWTIPKAALMFAFYLSYAGSAATPVLIAWANTLNAADPTLRHLLVAVANVVSYAWVLWVPLVLFPTQDAPKYKYGYQILILFGGLAIISVTFMGYMHRRKAQNAASQSTA